MKKYKIVLILTVLAVILASCSAPKQASDEPSSKAETTSATTALEKTTATTTEENTEKESSTAEPDESKFVITQEEATNIITELYGSLYKVTETKYKDGILYLSLEDKTGKPFAEVSVNLETANAEEKLLSTGKTTEFNLLS